MKNPPAHSNPITEPTPPTTTVAQYLAGYLNQCNNRSPLSSGVYWRRYLARIGFDEAVDEDKTPKGYTRAIYLKDGSVLRKWVDAWLIYAQGNDQFKE